MPAARDPLLRFWEKIDKTEGCWLWTAGTTRAGYGMFHPKHGVSVYAHRFSYELQVGPIPDGLQLDHLCRVRACVNPAHLEPVTNRENGLRGISPAAVNARKTHCYRGHLLAGDNLIRESAGRRCRECQRQWKREYEKRRALGLFDAYLARGQKEATG